MLWCTTADRQERDWKGEKAQENIKKKDCASGPPIQHFMPQPGNQKVSEWIAEHLQQIDGLQIWHFVPRLAIKKWQLRGKQLCESVPHQNS
ncbi:44278_t:CDS:2 [Gigaspora margarita]|uniref:44278_t:CDS:1 n=1 Tax=Gigaspora margarita TaxID=4874 RepID=A0ABM8W444_GIGMA|nr:44278_t:CDS:2 [Gigaspora margarita]